MKIKSVWILPPLVGLLGAFLLAGKALTQKQEPLPPTGSSSSPNSSPLSPDSSRSWLDAGRRWGVYSETAEWLEEPEDATPSPFDKLPAPLRFLAGAGRVTGASGILPTPGLSPPPLHTSPPVRGELVEPRTERKEPTIRQVQLAAIRYAEVRPEKIRHWRTLAQLRNFVPRFTIGLDRDRDTTIASSTSGGKTTFAVGPEDETLSVDFGFTWDLASMVWDSAQTSIDVRSRLMVQLRQDILEETTRLYFERRRLMNEFEAAPADDSILKKERSLRLQELTAQLDALTGGLYSEEQ